MGTRNRGGPSAIGPVRGWRGPVRYLMCERSQHGPAAHDQGDHHEGQAQEDQHSLDGEEGLEPVEGTDELGLVPAELGGLGAVGGLEQETPIQMGSQHTTRPTRVMAYSTPVTMRSTPRSFIHPLAWKSGMLISFTVWVGSGEATARDS